MRQGTTITVPADGCPIGVADAKRQLRIDVDDTTDDMFIATLCATAYRTVEGMLGYPILRQTRQTHLHEFPVGSLWLGSGDNIVVDSVTYIDSMGAEQVLAPADYVIDRVSRPAGIWALGSWPTTARRPGAVVVTWTSGWSDPADVPSDLRHAMLMLVGHFEQNREAVTIGQASSAVDMAVDMLVDPYRIMMFR